MGSHRKHKTNPKHGLSSPPSSMRNIMDGAHATESYHDEEDEDDDSDFSDTPKALDFAKVLQDVEGSLVGTMTTGVIAISNLFSPDSSNQGGTSIHLGLQEVLALGLAIVVLASLSIFMGVAAGITISIHYFDTHTTPSFPRLEARERELGSHRRITNLDYSIVSRNILYPPLLSSKKYTKENEKAMELTLGRVITMSETGQRSVLMVVQETEPLQSLENTTDSQHTITSNNNASNNRSDDFEVLFDGQYRPYRHKGPPDPRFPLSYSKVHPKVCPDRVTIGFDNWKTLKAAVDEANALAAERFMRWTEYFASIDESDKAYGSIQEDSRANYFYDEDNVFTICPGTTLVARNKEAPIYINADNIVIECGDPEEYVYQQGGSSAVEASLAAMLGNGQRLQRSSFSRPMPTCAVNAAGTHLAFGPHAHNVLVRGIVFQSARTSSLAFHYNGAQASFEDCIWINNVSTNGKYGSVADVNSSSSVNFYRCEIGSSLASVANFGGPHQTTNSNNDNVNNNDANSPPSASQNSNAGSNGGGGYWSRG